MAPVEFQSRGTIEQIKVKLHFLSVFMFDLREFDLFFVLFFSSVFFSRFNCLWVDRVFALLANQNIMRRLLQI